MTLVQLQQCAYEDLEHILDRPGEVIYSSAKTLRKGDIYLLGFNPGGISDTYHSGIQQKTTDDSIRTHIKNMLTKTHNSYVHENWSTEEKTYKEGEAPLQKRVKSLLKYLDYDVEDVCSANLIFVKSENASLVDYGLAGYCWRFHERILEVVKPKTIICFGISSESPYQYLKSLFNVNDNEIDECKSGHGDWYCKYFKTKISGLEVGVVAVPHLSYYNISDKNEALIWIRDKIK